MKIARYLFAFGALMVVLPQFGYTLTLTSWLSDDLQILVGILMLVIGFVLFAWSWRGDQMEARAGEAWIAANGGALGDLPQPTMAAPQANQLSAPAPAANTYSWDQTPKS